MIGQKKLLNLFNSYTLADLPHTMLFIGETGCGKHTLANYVAFKHKLIVQQLTLDDLTEYICPVLPTLYILNLSDITIKQQNSLLKFIEEPASTVYIILLATSDSVVLPTVLNRSIKYYFESYTVDELSEYCASKGIIKSDLILQFCRTPGQINFADTETLQLMLKKCTAYVEALPKISYDCSIGFSAKINLKKDEQPGKFNFDIFLRILSYVVNKNLRNNPTNTNFKAFVTLSEDLVRYNTVPVAKDAFLIELLSKLWRVYNEFS